jgi:hypothetical protein
MKIRIGNAYKIFMFSLKIYNGEVELLWRIEKERKRWFWLCYSNAKHDKRVWNKEKGKYHFCLQIPKVVEIDTAHIGKKIIGRLNLTRLFKKDYHVYSIGDGVFSSNGN